MQMENMLLKVYSLMVLMLDLLTLLFGIIISIIVAFYRTLRPPAMKSLCGEVAMVIGAGRGVGREIAFQLCLLGVKVACIDKNDKMCKATVQQASRDSAVIKPYICDITDKEQIIESLLSKTAAQQTETSRHTEITKVKQHRAGLIVGWVTAGVIVMKLYLDIFFCILIGYTELRRTILNTLSIKLTQ